MSNEGCCNMSRDMKGETRQWGWEGFSSAEVGGSSTEEGTVLRTRGYA